MPIQSTILPHPMTTSWVELLQHRVHDSPNFTVYRFLENGESVGDQRTFADLHSNACAIAAHLRTHYSHRSRVLLLHPPGLAFMDAFFGCLYAGMVPVPVNPPRANRHRQRVLAVIDDAAASAVLTNAADQARLQNMVDVTIIASDTLPAAANTFKPYTAAPDDLAFLQYTSGSTGTPKGVMVSHANLAANAYELHHGWGHRPGDILVTWLPVFHDMGLIYGMLMPIYAGISGVAMAPAAFLQRPLRWLRAIARFGGTHTAAPNFAYSLCAARASNEPLQDCDLSHWRVAVNGAEPIQAETLDSFAQAFAANGFDRDSFCPGYGLAETTLKVTASAYHEALTITSFDPIALESGHARPSSDGTRLVSCGGQPQRGGVQIVAPATGRVLPPDQVGEIWVHGPSVTAGYWQKPGHQSFSATIDDTPHLRTGDLGFIHRGELYITGRIKDLIIVRGRNILPQDIEAVATAAHAALQADGSAAFSLEQDDQVAIACEVNRLALRNLDAAAVIHAVRDAVWQHFDLDLRQVILLKPMRLPKTSSGKVQRQTCRQQVLDGSLEILHQDQTPTLSNHSEDLLIEVDANAFWRATLEEQQAQLRQLLQRRMTALSGRDHHDLRRVGLDSLQLLTLARQLEEDLQLHVPLAAFALAQHINDWIALLCDPPKPLSVPTQEANGDPQAVAPNQRALWFIHRSNPQQDPYTLTLALDIAAPLQQVEQAVHHWLAAHPALSTRFGERNGTPVRTPGSIEDIGIHHHARDAQLESLAAQPFDLSQQPPSRVHLIDDGEHTRLLLCVHHIVADFLALETLLRDLASSLSGMQPQQRPALKTCQATAADRDYWQQSLQAAPPQTLSFASGYVAKTHNRLERSHLTLDEATSVALHGRARHADVTLQSLLLACYAATWQRYNAPSRFAIGVPVDVRSHNDAACGYGIHTLPVIVDAEKDLLDHTQQQLWQLLEHRGQTFEAIAQQLPHQSEQHPVFQSLFTYHQDHQLSGMANWFLQAGLALDVGDWTFTSRAVTPPRAALPLSVTFAHSGNQLVGVLDSNSAQMPRGWRDDFRDSLRDTLQQVATHGIHVLQQPQQLPLPHPARLLPPAAAPECRDMVTHLLAQVAANADAPALQYRDQTWSYRQLGDMTEQIAAALKQQGVTPGDRVALVCRREPLWIAAMLAVAASGAAFVPISDSLPAKRIAYMLANSQPRLVAFTHASPLAQEIALPQLQLWQLPSERVPLHPPTPDSMAYILYTSGSTGQPKGVAIQHRGFANLLDHFQSLAFAQAPLKMAAMTTPIFDISLVEAFLPLSCGGTCVIAPSDDGLHQRADWINANQITVLQGTPTTFKMLLAQNWQPQAQQHILMGGEAISHQLIADLRNAAGVWNQYGPTEVSVWSSIRRIDGDSNQETHSPVGGAIRAVEIYVLDANMRQLPRGCAGELAIGGMPLAMGYWAKPELTAERFRPHPFAQTPGARLYLSGDLARGRSDGTYAFLGRNDSQIKLRGFRIEIGEIERVLNRQAGVTDAVVMVRQFGPDDARLVAFVLAAGDLDTRVLRQEIAAQLPEYMVPNHFEIMQQLPLTASNKTDRKALAALPLQVNSAGVDVAASDDPQVTQLTQLWREVLQKPELDEQANFFEQGGYSLLSLKLLDRIAEVCSARLTPRQLFEQPTPVGIAPLVASAGEVEVPTSCTAAVTEAPLHGIQRDFWVLEHSPRYRGQLHLAGYIEIDGPLDETRLEAALQAIVLRHAALRLTFHLDGEQPLQKLGSAAPAALQRQDVTGFSEAQLQAHMQQVFNSPFDLSQSVYRYQLMRFNAQRHRLLLCFHHIVADGTSMTLFCNDLLRAYAAPQKPLPAAPSWLDLPSGDRNGDATFWAQQLQLSDASCGLALQRTPSAARAFRLAYHSQVLPAAYGDALRKLAQQQQTTPSAVCLALFATWLQQLGAGERFTVAIPVANRSAQAALNTFGPGINMLPMVMKVGGDWQTVLAWSKQQSRELISHSAASMGQIVTQARQRLGGADLRPFFLFNWVPQRRHQFEAAGAQFQIHEQPPQTGDYLLSLEVIEREGDHVLRFAWAEGLLQRGIVHAWQQHFMALLQQLDGRTLPQVQVAVDLGGFRWKSHADVWQLFAEQVQARPQQAALLWQAQGMQCNVTYAALQQRVADLAAQLLACGLLREQVVALALDRGVANVVAMLAVLRAGAAFVPIAANVPLERARWMLADSGAELVLADSSRAADFADVDVLELDAEGRCATAEVVAEPRWPVIVPPQLAYLIYTSGTTGTPKAVAISRENLAAHVLPVSQTYSMQAGDRVTHQSSVGFDVMIEEVLASLCVGATVLPIAEAVKTDFIELAACWRELRPDVAIMNASLWQAWTDFIAEDADLPLPRVMIVGAERLAPAAARAWLARAPTAQKTLNAYGPTETTVTCSVQELAGAALVEAERVPIGQAISDGFQVVLDARQRPQAIGVRGELAIGGPRVGRGYWQRPELTAERFRPDPFSGEAGARLYLTGDIAVQLADGAIDLYGRIDHQVKLRGFRIELGEIENRLEALASVSAAAVYVHDNRELVAVIETAVIEADWDRAREMMQAQLHATLPEYMVPTHWMRSNRLPRLSNGKLDRTSLAKTHLPAHDTDSHVPVPYTNPDLHVPVPDTNPDLHVTVPDTNPDLHVTVPDNLNLHVPVPYTKHVPVPDDNLHVPVPDTSTDLHVTVPDNFTVTDTSADLHVTVPDNLHVPVPYTKPDLHVPVPYTNPDLHVTVPNTNPDLHVPVPYTNPDLHVPVPDTPPYTKPDLHVPVPDTKPDLHVPVPDNHTNPDLHVPVPDNHTNPDLHVPVPDNPPASWQARTPAEIALTQLWQQRWPHVHGSTHFFSQGGDSIWAITLSAKLRQMGWHLTMEDFYLAPTLQALAARMQPLTTEKVNASDPIDSNRSLAWPPLAAAMIAQGMSATSAAYFNQLAVLIRGPLDRERMLQAWRDLHLDQDGLRLYVAWDDQGHPQPLFSDPMHADVKLEEVTHIDETALTDFMRQTMAADKLRPFELGRAPLWRVVLYAVRPDLHVLLLSHHHLVIDGWSLSPLFISALARYRDQPAAPALSMRHYLAQLAQQSAAQAEAFWREQLHPLEAPTRLPLLRKQTAQFQVRHALLDLHHNKMWQATAARHQVTLATLMQAAWACTLAPFQQQSHFVFGTVNAGRNLGEHTYSQTVGLMIQSLPTVVDSRATVTQLLQHLHAHLPQASRHGHLPLRQIQACANAWPSGAKLFESIVVVENYPIDQALSDNDLGLHFEALETDEATELPLVLTLMPQADGWRARLSYRDPWWSQRDAARLLERWHLAMTALCQAAPHTPLNQLGRSNPQPLAPTQTPQPTLKLLPAQLHALFNSHAAQPAFVSADAQRDFAWWQRTSMNWAAALDQRGIGAGDVVGICLPNDERVHAAILALWFCGAAFCPLDPRLPKARMQAMADDCGMTWLLSERNLELNGVQSLPLAQLSSSSDGEAHFTPYALDPQELAYVLYTSGSTGTPKGVAITHAALAFYCDFAVHHYLQATGGAPFFGNLAFDATQTTLWPVLLAGQPLLLLPHPGEVLELAQWLTQPRKLALIKLTPAHLHAIQRVLQELNQRSRTHIECVVLGGEALTTQHVTLCRQLFGATRIINEYGPTEATVGCITYEIAAEDDVAADAAIAIGAPLPATAAYVLDVQQQPAVTGAEGQLFLAGPNLARGYFNRPAETAAAFIPDPFAANPGMRMYRSGDLASMDEDGALVYKGRADHMLKWRGYRIEPGEIEACLRHVEGVHEALVMVRAAGLVAWVSAALDQLQEQDLRDHAQSMLPAYMVPTRFVLLSALPLTANGKIDRDALVLDEPVETSDGAALSGQAEHLLAQWLAEALSIEPPNADDHFYALGGDSIVAIQLAAKAQALGYQLSPVEVMTRASVRAIAACLQRQQPQHTLSPQLQRAPFTPIMHWLCDQYGDLPQHYNQSVQLRLAHGTDLPRLQAALRDSIAAHDIFVARFRDGTVYRGEPAQLPTGRVIDLSHLTEKAVQEERNAVCRHMHAGFDPAQGKLIDFAIFVEHQTCWCFMVAHHLVCDGVTWRLLLQDAANRYAGGGTIAPAPSFLNWAQQLADYQVPQASHDYWLAQDLTPTPLPHSRQQLDDALGSQVETLTISATDTQGLLRMPLPLDLLLLAALNQAMLAVDDALLIELEHQGRDAAVAEDAHRMAGWFTALYPLRLAGASHVEACLRQLHGQLQALEPHRLAARLCLPTYRADVVFNYLGQLDGSLPAPFTRFVPRPNDEHSNLDRAYAWEWQAWVREGQLEFNWTFCPQRTAATDVSQMIKHVEAALSDLLALPLSRLPASLQDYPLVNLQADQLQALLEAHGRPAQILPLLPVQQGMLFQDAVAEGSAYVSQLQAHFASDLDLAAFKTAWQLVCERHATFHSLYLWLGFTAPLQVELAQARLAWHHWLADEIADLDDFAHQLRHQGFDLSAAPPLRFDLIEVADGYRFFWTFHHILSDGWSNAIVFRELERAYVAACAGEKPPLPEAVPLRRLVQWQAQIHGSGYWRERLRALESAALLPAHSASKPWRVQARLSDSLVAQLKAVARTCELTPFTFLQAAFALMLQRQTAAASVCFGITHAGRDAQITGIEEMVGPLLCTLPTLTHFPDLALMAWLQDLAHAHLADREHGYLGLPQIRQEAGIARSHPLFEALLVLENYPLDAQLRQNFGGVAVRDVAVEEVSHYALGASITLQPHAHVCFAGDGQKLSREQAQACLDDFCALLQLLVEQKSDRLHDLIQPIAAAPQATSQQTPIEMLPHGDPANCAALCQIFAQVLGHEQVAGDQGFHSLGGDSIAAMVLVSRARQVGFAFGLRQLLQWQTPQALCSFVATTSVEPSQVQLPVGTAVPLLPMQRHFLLHQTALHQHFAMPIALAVAPLDVARLRDALTQVCQRQPVFHLSFTATPEPRAFVRSGPTHLFSVIDTHLGDNVLKGLALLAAPFHATSNLAQDPLLHGLLVRDAAQTYLLLTAHHLVVDAVSWATLLQDLSAAYAGQSLPPLDAQRYLRVAQQAAEMPFHFELQAIDLGQTQAVVPSFAAQLEQAENLTLHLSREADAEPLLLTALLQTLAPWLGAQPAVWRESHGRADFAESDDLCGWFTQVSRVSVDVDAPITAQLRAVRDGLKDQHASGRAGVLFNYLGRATAGLPQPFSEWLEVPFSDVRPPQARPDFELEISVIRTSEGFATRFRYVRGRLSSDWITDLNRAWQSRLDDLCQHVHKLLAPQDFPLLEISQQQLDQLAKDTPGFADLWPLSPLQQGLLYHAVASKAQAYHEQLLLTLAGDLDIDTFCAAWRATFAQHASLRTAFRWQPLPLQVVYADAVLPIQILDWREQVVNASDLEGLLAADRQQGFALDQAPLARLVVVRAPDDVTHVLFAHHHLVLDGWSASLILAEVVARYVAARDNTPYHGATCASYATYLRWLQQQDAAALRAYWARTLAGFEAASPLPLARPQLHDTTDEVLELTREFSTEAQAALHLLQERCAVTYSVLAQAAWACVVTRYGNCADPLFGVTFAGRPEALPELERTPGLFVQTLPVRARMTEGINVTQWLEMLAQQQLDHQQHGALALSDIQAQCDVPAGQVLFEALLVFGAGFHAHVSLADTLGVNLRETRVHETTHYPLTLTFLASDRGFSVRLGARRSHYAAESLPKLVRALEAAWLAMAQQLTQPVRGLQIVPQDWCASWLRAGWGKQFEVPTEDLLQPAYLRVLQAQTAEIALWDETGQTLSYAQLASLVRQLAAQLQARGVRAGDGVLVCLPREAITLAMLLAIHAVGAYYVPLDPDYPPERIALIADDAHAKGIVTQPDLLHLFPADAHCWLLEDLSAAKPETFRPLDHITESLSHVIYTSGSTGKPKGVAITHANVAALTAWARQRYAARVWQGVVAGTSLCFDLSIFEIFVTLSLGGRVLLVQNALSLAGDTLPQDMRLVNTVPSAMAELLQLNALPDSLEAINLAGEPLRDHLAQAILKRFPQVTLHNLYGPTEATTYLTEQLLPPMPVTIGRALPHAALHVLDAQLQPLPPGVRGEGYICGPHVARGYLGNAALTAERFVPDPFETPTGEPFGLRMYRTGDLLWRDDLGKLHFVGRVDFQVKLNGFRIELGEIEACLNGHAAVEEAIVMTQQHAGVAQLVAFIKSAQQDLAELLKAHAAATLPHYMVPARWLVLAALPLTPNGKVDRKALLAVLDEQPRLLHAQGAEPVFAEAAILRHLLLDVLNPPSLDLNCDFWQLGGHSLLALRLLARINETFAVQLPLAAILEAPNMLDLARAIADRQKSVNLLEAQAQDAPMRLAPLQTRLWFIAQLEAQVAAYNMPYAVMLRGALNVDALDAALRHLGRQHAILRTYVPDEDGVFYQLLQALPPLQVEVLPEDDLKAEMAAEAQTPFAVTQGPLLRYRLLRLAEDRHVLLVTIHHLVFDGWSLGILVRDLARNYAAQLSGAPLPTPARLQFHDYAAWEWQRQAQLLDGERAYWSAQLADLPAPLPLPFDTAAREIAQTGTFQFALDDAIVSALQDCARARQMTPFMVLQASFAVALAQWCDVDDLVLGTPASNRPHAATEDMVGMFVNTLPLRLKLTQQTDFEAVLTQVRKTTLAAFEHAAISFDQIVDLVQPPRVADRPAIFQVLFALQNLDLPRFDLEDLDCEVLNAAPPQAKLDLSLYVVPDATGWSATFEYRADRFTPAKIEAFAQTWCQSLTTLLQQPQTSLQFQRGAPLLAGTVAAKSNAAQDQDLLALVLAVFAQVLPVDGESLNADTDFFAVGGNSLLAARAIARLRQRLGSDLPLKTIFDQPTAAQLSNGLAAMQEQPSRGDWPALPSGAQTAPLSLTQNGMWVMHQTEGHSGNFNMARAAWLEGALNVARLQRAIACTHVVQPLLSSCVVGEGQPQWQLKTDLTLPFTFNELADDTAAQAAANDFALAPFDLIQAGPVRYLMLKTAHERYLFVIVLHHIAGDEWSLQVLYDQLLDFYSRDRDAAELTTPTHSYLDFAHWQRRWLTGDVLAKHLAFFKSALSGLPTALTLPTDRPRPAQQGFAAALLHEQIDATSLHAFAHKQGGTLYQLCFATFALLLSRHAQQWRFAIATPAANRPLPELETMVGCFANTLVAAVDWAPDAPFDVAFAKLREHLFEVQRYQALPFELLVRQLNPPRDDSRHPVAQVGFALQNVPRQQAALADVTIAPASLGELQARFDLELYLHEADGALMIDWIYKTELFEAATIASFNRQWQHLLHAIIAAPHTMLEALPLETAVVEVDETLDVDGLSEDDLDALLGDLMDEDLT